MLDEVVVPGAMGAGMRHEFADGIELLEPGKDERFCAGIRCLQVKILAENGQPHVATKDCGSVRLVGVEIGNAEAVFGVWVASAAVAAAIEGEKARGAILSST